jgi:DNA-binding MarR family transcriptional regulator
MLLQSASCSRPFIIECVRVVGLYLRFSESIASCNREGRSLFFCFFFDMTITQEELQTLTLLDAIGGNSRITQRQLSEATGFNLSKINFLLKRLAQKGQVKLRSISENPNKIRYLYILTPGGMAEKSRLALRFAKQTILEYARTVDVVQHHLLCLKQSGAEKILLLGEGAVADLVLEAIPSIEGLEVVAIVSPHHAGSTRRGTVVTASAIGLAYDRVVPCDDQVLQSKHLLKQVGIPKEKLWLM